MKVFIPMLAGHAGIRDRDLLEEDVRLHLLLEPPCAAGREAPEEDGAMTGEESRERRNRAPD